MSLSILQIEQKLFLLSFLISKKNIFKYLCFQYFDAWLFYPSAGVKSQLKFSCLRQKNHLKPFLKV